jgi:hypothetical protein
MWGGLDWVGVKVQGRKTRKAHEKRRNKQLQRTEVKHAKKGMEEGKQGPERTGRKDRTKERRAVKKGAHVYIR